MTAPRHRPEPPRSPSPAASAELLPVLVWLNRHALASRFPAWQPLPGPHAGEAEPEAPLARREHGDPP